MKIVVSFKKHFLFGIVFKSKTIHVHENEDNSSDRRYD
jgi:hypothetical protein